MKTNILYLDNAFWKTDLEEWPKKPKNYDAILTNINSSDADREAQFANNECYRREITEARSHLTPIVEEDWKWIKYLIYEKNPIVSLDGFRKFEPVNGTIYKDTGINLEEVEQVKGYGKWCDRMFSGNDYKIPSREYRKAFRVVKEHSELLTENKKLKEQLAYYADKNQNQ